MPSKSLIVLLAGASGHRPLSLGRDVRVVACAPPEEIKGWIPEAHDPHPLDLCREIRAEIPAATEQLSRFLAGCKDWPLFQFLQGRKLPASGFQNRSMFWLFNYLSEKNYPLLKVNAMLAALIVLRRIRNDIQPQHVEVFGGEPREREFLIRALTPRCSIAFPVVLEYANVIARFCLAIARQFLTWRFLWRNLPSPSSKKPPEEVALLSAIPLIWKPFGNHWRDRYYHRLPENIPGSRFLFSVRDESLSIHAPEMRKRWNEIQLIGRDVPLADHSFLESFVRPVDFLIAYWQGLGTFIRFLLIRHQVVRRLHLDGVRLWPMLREKFETSVIQLPEVLLNYRAARRFVRQTGCRKLVMHGFELRWNRAVTLGAHHENAQVVGIQHGPFTTMKGLYSYFEEELDKDYLDMMPDAILVDGETPKAVLCRYNQILTNRIHVLGAPRFDGLANKLREIQLGKDGVKELGLVMLVTPGHTDTMPVITILHEYVLSAADRIKEIIFKTHPLVGEPGERAFLDAFADLDGRISLAVSRDDVHQLMLRADLLACTYSSCGVEALALGLPVFCLDVGMNPNFSQLLDFPAYQDFIGSAEEFRDHLANMSAKRQSTMAMRPDIEAGFFHRLDGHSTERMAEFILNHGK